MMPFLPVMQMLGTLMSRAMVMTQAVKKLKKTKKMDKKMAKKTFKQNKKKVMARVMAGQMPQQTDFISSRDQLSYFEFPVMPGTPVLPGEIPLQDYMNLFKMMNG